MSSTVVSGYGTVSANGGAGGTYSGGGAGGRIAMYFRQNRTSTGFRYESHGGSPYSCGECEGGGAGTVFLYDNDNNHRTLYIANANRSPNNKLIDWDNLEQDGCRTWILPASRSQEFVTWDNDFMFEELQIYDKANLAVLPYNETIHALGQWPSAIPDLMTATYLDVPSSPVVSFLDMTGDRTGAVHLNNMQTIYLDNEDIDLPFNAYINSGANFSLATRTIIHNVEVYNSGSISNIRNLTLRQDGYLWLMDGGHTGGNTEDHYQFDTVRIQDSALINAVTDPISDPGVTFITDEFYIEGGGELRGTKITMMSINVTIDSAGVLTVDGNGYASDQNDESHGDDSIHGTVNSGKPPDTLGIGAGGSHGGSGGRGPGETNGKTGLPYGDLYEPYVFGSSGGTGPDGHGGGSGAGIIWMNITGKNQLLYTYTNKSNWLTTFCKK